MVFKKVFTILLFVFSYSYALADIDSHTDSFADKYMKTIWRFVDDGFIDNVTFHITVGQGIASYDRKFEYNGNNYKYNDTDIDVP